MSVRMPLTPLLTQLLVLAATAGIPLTGDTLAAGRWSTGTLSAPRTDPAVAVVGTKVLFAGGYPGGFSQSAAVDIYDMTTARWTATALSLARTSVSAATVHNADRIL